MRKTRLSPPWVAQMLLASALVWVGPAAARAQVPERSASDLLEFLTYRSPDRRGKSGLSGCGAVNADRAAAVSLTRPAAGARQKVEEAVGSIEQKGRRSEFSLNGGWILLAYAKIGGRASFPTLRRLVGSRALAGTFLDFDLDNAIALSLGLTSYVSSSREPVDFVCRPEQPRDVLDRLLLAWENNDALAVGSALDPDALRGLRELLRRSTWPELRNEIWGAKPLAQTSVGYRLDLPGPWSEPEETLDEARKPSDFSALPRPLESVASFTRANGEGCGELVVEFTRLSDDNGSPRFFIANSDIEPLLRLVASCAAGQ